MESYYKTEGHLIYPDETSLDWGPFYFRSFDNATNKMDELLKYIVEWVRGDDESLNVEPENFVKTKDGKIIIFDVKAWKDENTLENCKALITVENIFFED